MGTPFDDQGNPCDPSDVEDKYIIVFLCNAGRHRSVTFAEFAAEVLAADNWTNVKVQHLAGPDWATHRNHSCQAGDGNPPCDLCGGENAARERDHLFDDVCRMYAATTKVFQNQFTSALEALGWATPPEKFISEVIINDIESDGASDTVKIKADKDGDEEWNKVGEDTDVKDADFTPDDATGVKTEMDGKGKDFEKYLPHTFFMDAGGSQSPAEGKG